ncbi:LytR/AlgR family response regulator transcription factor [Sphingobacterium tabacisoli]|uniref:LytR/AlgR family response regulator transcription factor n=1 Tax=Sphingobacterium tabacisoli TaxID=2044855 RepID=A0ABW5L8H2_9SPHI|nr:LytTR family DNA-binding domain-containing protein [Sphingobacterium tabacisoli]
MPKFQFVIVDDQNKDADELHKNLLKIDGSLEIKTFVSAVDASKYLMTNKPDVLFLDIKMPDITGLELYNMLPEQQRPVLVLVTTYTEFALDGIRLNVADYLVKPVGYKDVYTAYVRALARMNIAITIQANIEPERNFFYIKNSKVTRILEYKDIICMTADDNYITIYTREEVLVSRKTLKEVESHMPHSYMVRIRKNVIVNFRFAKIIQESSLIIPELDNMAFEITKLGWSNIKKSQGI